MSIEVDEARFDHLDRKPASSKLEFWSTTAVPTVHTKRMLLQDSSG
jgi:hypothetical protein